MTDKTGELSKAGTELWILHMEQSYNEGQLIYGILQKLFPAEDDLTSAERHARADAFRKIGEEEAKKND